MKMTIRTRHRGRAPVKLDNGSVEIRSYKFENTCNMGAAGYASIKEMQKELIRRFPDGIRNRKNRRIRNGLIVREGIRNDRTTQVITLSN